MHPEEAKLRARIASWEEALRAKDIERLMSHYTPDVMTFSLAAPAMHRGAVYREALQAWMDRFDGPIGCERHDLRLTMGDEVAFFTCLNHITGTHVDGTAADIWVRATVGFRQLDGEWYCVHEHVSVPFDMNSGRAIMNLRS